MPGEAKGKIFISYRRDDAPGFAQALYMRLEQEFGGQNLFMDVEGNIKPGDDFVKVLSDQIALCDVLLAIIGESWTAALDEEGKRRLEKEGDFVRIEIASALQLGKRVIPVLVNEAEIPRVDDLPSSLKPLARRNAVAIWPTRFKADSQGLINALKDALAAAELERAAKTEAERKAAEEERRRREAEEEARAAQVEAAAKARAQAGLTLDEIRKAEELANWDFIKDSANPNEFRDHLARFGGGTTDRYGRKKLEALLWADPTTRFSIEALRKFLDEFPKGDYAGEAQGHLAKLEKAAEAAREVEEDKRAETEAWAKVAASTLIADFEAFLTQWPNGAHAASAKGRIKELRGGLFSRRGVLKGFYIGAASTAAAVLAVLLYSALTTADRVSPQSYDRIFSGHKGSVNSVAFSPDGRTALSGSADETLKLWDLATGEEIRTFSGHKRSVNSVAFSPDGRKALSGSADETLKLWYVASGDEFSTFTRGFTGSVNSVAFSPDGHTALSGGNHIMLWNLATGWGRELSGGQWSAWVYSVVFSPDGRTALSGSSDKTTKLWDLATGKEIRTFRGDNGWIDSVALSPDGRAALSGSSDKTIKLWDLATGNVIRTFRGHTDAVTSVALSPDGRTALSGSSDKTTKLWDLATGKEIWTFNGHTDAVTSVALSPDGRTALSGSSDKTVRLWHLSPYLTTAR